MNHREYDIQVTVADYLTAKYPRTIYLSDARANVKLNVIQASRSKRIQMPDFAFPDLFIFNARHGYHGAALELKAVSPFKKNGELKSNDHLYRQNKALEALSNAGYYTAFVTGANEAIAIIDWYLK